MARTDKDKLSRKERERDRHRREMLNAAERVFVRKGYHGATVEEIAQEAEFSVGTLYNFFQGKDDLYAQVVDKIAREFMELLDERVLSVQDPEEALGELVALRMEHIEEHRGFFRVFVEASPGSRLDPAGALPADAARLYDEYIDLVAGIFERGVKAGRFEPMDPLYLALCLEGIINGVTAYWARREPEESLAVRAEKLKEAFLDRLRTRPH